MFSVNKMESRLDSLLSRLETRDPFSGSVLENDGGGAVVGPKTVL